MWTVLKIAWPLKSRFCRMLWVRGQEIRLKQTGKKILAKKPTYTHGTATVLKKHLLRTEQMWTNHRSVKQTHQDYEITRAVLGRVLSPNHSANAD